MSTKMRIHPDSLLSRHYDPNTYDDEREQIMFVQIAKNSSDISNFYEWWVLHKSRPDTEDAYFRSVEAILCARVLSSLPEFLPDRVFL